MNSKRIIVFGACLVCLVALGLRVGMPGQTQSDRIEAAVLELSSMNEIQRQSAKEFLIAQGSAGIESVLNLLSELRAYPRNRPRFAMGREAEGSEIWQELNQEIERSTNKWDEGNFERKQALMRELAKIEISDRLRKDCIELLGDLRAKEAVPVLITIVREDDSVLPGAGTNIRPEMKSLISIGEAAVPQLIDALYAALDPNNYPMELIPNLSANENQLIRQSKGYAYQSRLIVVLADIRDPRAIPVIEQILNQNEDGTAISVYCVDAIEKIRERE